MLFHEILNGLSIKILINETSVDQAESFLFNPIEDLQSLDI